MARVIAICNAKGGVGKTTTAVNVSAYLAHHGKRVLLVDFDPQANASSAFGVKPVQVQKSIYHGVLNQVEPQDLIHQSAVNQLHLIPSAPHLAGLMVELVNLPEREYFLRKFVHRLRHAYDYILIDLPPSTSLLTINGLLAANEVVIPVQAQYYSLEGLGQLLEMIDLIQNNMGHTITIAGAVITMFDENDTLSRDVEKEMREHFGHPLFQTKIPRSVPLAEAPSFSQPILLYRPDSFGAVAYEKLAREIIDQEIRLVPPANEFVSENFGNFNII
ncbi:MAG: ParA family protein [Patescibacteria group bacterium]